MHSIILMIFALVFAQTQAKELATMHSIDTQDSNGNFVESMLERMLKDSPIPDADLDTTILAKPGHVAIPDSTRFMRTRASFVNPQAFPARHHPILPPRVVFPSARHDRFGSPGENRGHHMNKNTIAVRSSENDDGDPVLQEENRAIYVSGFDFGTTEEQLREHCKAAGPIESIQFINKGNAVVTYATEVAAKEALGALQETTIKGNKRYIWVRIFTKDKVKKDT